MCQVILLLDASNMKSSKQFKMSADILKLILTNVNEIFVARIDVEAPEFESESFRVMVFRNLDIQVMSNKSNLKISSVA